MKKCFQINPEDNVAVLLEDAGLESIEVIGARRSIVATTQPIGLGHKVAISTVAVGAPICKFGVLIGIATVPIGIGEWVHLHNCSSQLDERSNTLDVDTGAAGDTIYE
jgi:altronate dehydratase small subunit